MYRFQFLFAETDSLEVLCSRTNFIYWQRRLNGFASNGWNYGWKRKYWEKNLHLRISHGIACCPLFRIHCACAQHKNGFGSWLSCQFCHLDYESTWIFLFFLMFLHSFRFVAPIAMIKIQREHCTCTKSLSIHFCINFFFACLSCFVSPGHPH